jgi:hypothetical protein
MVMSERGCATGYTGLYRWWNLCYGGKEEPHYALMKRKHVTGLRAAQLSERLLSHLFPNEEPYTRSTATLAAKTEQSNEHGEKQDDVCDDEDDDVRSAALWVEYYALQLSGVPVRAELQIDEPRRVKGLRQLIHLCDT